MNTAQVNLKFRLRACSTEENNATSRFQNNKVEAILKSCHDSYKSLSKETDYGSLTYYIPLKSLFW